MPQLAGRAERNTVPSLAALLAALGSRAPPVTVTLLRMPGTGCGVTRVSIVTWVLASGASGPSAHETSGALKAHVGAPGLTDTKPSALGSGSSSVMDGDTDGPRFVTCRVYVRLSRESTGSAESDLLIARSACGVSAFVSVAVLSARTGSVTPAGGVTEAVFARAPVAAGSTRASSV